MSVLVTPTCTALLAKARDTEVTSLFTVMEMFAVVCNPELFCVPATTYVVVGEDKAGVPEISPVVVFRFNPLGSAGLTEKLLMSPPVETMLVVGSGEPAKIVRDAGE